FYAGRVPLRLITPFSAAENRNAGSDRGVTGPVIRGTGQISGASTLWRGARLSDEVRNVTHGYLVGCGVLLRNRWRNSPLHLIHTCDPTPAEINLAPGPGSARESRNGLGERNPQVPPA